MPLIAFSFKFIKDPRRVKDTVFHKLGPPRDELLVLFAVNVTLELVSVLTEVLIHRLFDDVIDFVYLALSVTAIVRELVFLVPFRFLVGVMNGSIPVSVRLAFFISLVRDLELLDVDNGIFIHQFFFVFLLLLPFFPVAFEEPFFQHLLLGFNQGFHSFLRLNFLMVIFALYGEVKAGVDVKSSFMVLVIRPKASGFART